MRAQIKVSVRMKRESGANPEQSRCCKGGFSSLRPLAYAEKGGCSGLSQKTCLKLFSLFTLRSIGKEAFYENQKKSRVHPCACRYGSIYCGAGV